MAASAHILLPSSLRPAPPCSQQPRLLCLRSFFIPTKPFKFSGLDAGKHDKRKMQKRFFFFFFFRMSLQRCFISPGLQLSSGICHLSMPSCTPRWVYLVWYVVRCPYFHRCPCCWTKSSIPAFPGRHKAPLVQNFLCWMGWGVWGVANSQRKSFPMEVCPVLKPSKVSAISEGAIGYVIPKSSEVGPVPGPAPEAQLWRHTWTEALIFCLL